MKYLVLTLSILGGCAPFPPDPYSGYYVGSAAVVRIAPMETGLFLVVLGEKGRETTLIGEGEGGILEAGSGEPIKMVQDGDGYSLRAPGRVHRIERIDSLGYEKSRIALLGNP